MANSGRWIEKPAISPGTHALSQFTSPRTTMQERRHDREDVEQAALEAQAEQVSPLGSTAPPSSSRPKFEALVKLCSPDVESTVRRSLRPNYPRIGIEDVVQQIWMSVATGLQGYKSEPPGFLAWLNTIARNQVRNAIRDATTRGRGGVSTQKSADEGQVEGQAMDTATSVFSGLSSKEQIARITKGLRHCLPKLLGANREHAEVIAQRHFGLDATAAIEALDSPKTLSELLLLKEKEFQKVSENMVISGSEHRNERACRELYSRAMVRLGKCLMLTGAAPDRLE